MRCPFCGETDTQVKDSRLNLDNNTIKRRRFCSSCNSRFTTYERIEMQELVVIKKDGSKRPFDRQKLLKSVTLATRKRPINTDQVEKVVNNITQKIEQLGEVEIESKKIGHLAIEELAKLDDVSYIRFASVYHDFSNIQDFENFLHKFHQLQK